MHTGKYEKMPNKVISHGRSASLRAGELQVMGDIAMIEAHTLKSIIGGAKRSLSEPIIIKEDFYIFDGSDDDKLTIGYMTSLTDQKRIRKQIIEKKVYRNSKLIGILFCNPNSELGKNEILSHLPYFHHRSGAMCDFYCVGYGAHWPPGHYADQKTAVCIDGNNWFFSAVAFNNIRKDLEASCDWLFSGEAELILLKVEKKNNEIHLDFDMAITCNLERMKKDNAFSSVRNFFESIFQFAENYSGKDPIWDISDREGISKGKDLLLNSVLLLLPKPLRDTYKSTKHFAVSNISKKP